MQTIMDLENMASEVIEIVNSTHQNIFQDSLDWKNISTVMKGDNELVSEYDEYASDFLTNQLRIAFPDIAVISEESSPDTFTNVPDQYWLIDPIDGITNFVRGIPFASISISLVDAGSPVIGITKNIFSGDIYHAYQGGGFYKNSTRIQRKTNEEMKILSIGFPHKPSLRPIHLRNFNSVFNHFTEVRRFGSCCLDLCLLCEGKFNAVFEILKSWDFYAGIVMAKEVGLKYHIAEKDIPLDQDVYFICGEEEQVDYILEETSLIL